MKIIQNENIPPANGHYSPCLEHNGTLYISGQLPRDVKSGIIPEGIVKQTHTVLDNLFEILDGAGSSQERLLSVRIYLSDIHYWDEVNKIYSERMGNHKPARCVVPTRDLHYNCQIEIEAIAASGK
jgi:reactive intermediate/imine deaminase